MYEKIKFRKFINICVVEDFEKEKNDSGMKEIIKIIIEYIFIELKKGFGFYLKGFVKC